MGPTSKQKLAQSLRDWEALQELNAQKLKEEILAHNFAECERKHITCDHFSFEWRTK